MALVITLVWSDLKDYVDKRLMLIFKKAEKEKKNLLPFADPGAGFLKHSVEPWVSDLEYSMEIASWLHVFFL